MSPPATPREPPPFDEGPPFDPPESRRQIDALLDLLGPAPRRVLDLGCGDGRVLRPLAAAGHEVTGLDRDAGALARCAAALAGGAGTVRLVEADFARRWPDELGRFDAVCCLGNTMMTVADVHDAVTLLARSAAALADGGVFVMDDCPADGWPELTGGNWQAGLSEDGAVQMVWAPDDAVFALRTGDEIDAGDFSLRPGDRRLRLWSRGALELAARLAGLSVSARASGRGLLVMCVVGR